MKKQFLIVFVFALLLAACTSQASPTPQPPTLVPPTATQAEPTPLPSTPTAAPEEPEPTPTAEPSPTPAAKVVSFTIIPGESTVTYEVGEVFISDNNQFNLAVGTTAQITGEIQIDYSNPQNSVIGPVSVNIYDFSSDANRRDNYIRDNGLESSKYPLATFTPTKIEGLPESGEEGVDYPLTITGDLTIKEVTKEVTFEAVIRLEGDTLTGSATTTILMSDFGVGPISILGILNTEDVVVLTLNFVAQAATPSE
jgi:polyisoprenoid-binding protein YceI